MEEQRTENQELMNWETEKTPTAFLFRGSEVQWPGLGSVGSTVAFLGNEMH